ncbi:hypothetical protein AB205_0108500 [Aquarana catesbeiana]|uniref:Uncharacterized protein n=1 Tax=Aquarana catesbeiana TaxID=8400 RepID=A0A2G9SKM2_AQUCT|nr:hypothetical protein AB205_0108500 [Aquarana catesbeiana]
MILSLPTVIMSSKRKLPGCRRENWKDLALCYVEQKQRHRLRSSHLHQLSLLCSIWSLWMWMVWHGEQALGQVTS